MSELLITPILACILTPIYAWLSMSVILRRFKYRIHLGHNDNKDMKYAMRRHGNFFEYSLWFLVLILLSELVGAAQTALITVSSLFLLGRLLHISGFMPTSRFPRLRQRGMQLTMIGMNMAAVILAYTLITQ